MKRIQYNEIPASRETHADREPRENLIKERAAGFSQWRHDGLRFWALLHKLPPPHHHCFHHVMVHCAFRMSPIGGAQIYAHIFQRVGPPTARAPSPPSPLLHRRSCRSHTSRDDATSERGRQSIQRPRFDLRGTQKRKRN